MKFKTLLLRYFTITLFLVLTLPFVSLAEAEKMDDEIRRFFDAYNASFLESPEAVAKFYNEPCVTARMGVPNLNPTRQDTINFFGPVLERYRSRGWAYGEILSLEHRALGINSILATVRWAYKNKDGNTLWEWTFSYNLYKSEGGWKILLQTMHDSQPG